MTEHTSLFDRIAHHWWDLDGPMALLHAMTPLRVDFTERHAGATKNLEILDVGCGAGILSEALAHKGHRVTGIDPSERLIKTAKIHARQSGLDIDYQCTLAHDYAQDAKRFDVVICSEVLEHVDDPQTLFHTCHTLCKPNGSLIISTLNQTPTAFFKAIVATEYIFNWLPKGTHRYEQMIKPSTIAGWARTIDQSLVTLEGIEVNPWQKTARLTQDVSTQYICCFQ